MSETRKIVIEINENSGGNGGGSSTTNIVNGSGDVNVDIYSLLHPVKTLENKIFGQSVFLNQSYQQAKKLVTEAIDYSLTRYFTLSEDYLSENTYNNVMTAINKTTSLASSIGAGAMVGGVYGAVAGAAVWGATQIISGINKKNSYYANINAATYQTEFLKKRASLVDNSQGTEN